MLIMIDFIEETKAIHMVFSSKMRINQISLHYIYFWRMMIIRDFIEETKAIHLVFSSKMRIIKYLCITLISEE